MASKAKNETAGIARNPGWNFPFARLAEAHRDPSKSRGSSGESTD
jgi:hypothetical protein